jgi:predicted enzyme related to lactoylglutathione lyase
VAGLGAGAATEVPAMAPLGGEHGGAPVMAPYPEGDLWVATFRDPAGNIVGVWQQGPRS